MRPPPQVLRRRSANMRRKSTRRSTRQGTAGAISPGSSDTFAALPENNLRPSLRAKRSNPLIGYHCSGLLRRGACHRARISRDPLAPRNDDTVTGLSQSAIEITKSQKARAFLLKHRADYDAAVKDFRWPDSVPFNWALDWFDAELAQNADSKDRPAL